MKLLTLNAHAHLEPDYEEKTRLLADFILRERPDAVALQESSQPADAPEADLPRQEGMLPLPARAVPLRRGNHASTLARLLRGSGIPCSWTWLPVKRGYGRLDEGLAFLSLTAPLSGAETVLLSRARSYENWKTRRALCVRIQGRSDWFCCVHMGWWDDPQEPFLGQWIALSSALAERRASVPVWLMGDFNCPAQYRREGYDRILADGWHDPWQSALCVRDGSTVRTDADGWRGRPVPPDGLRIDHIFSSRPVRARRAEIVLDGTRGPVVSDHAGLLLDV